MLLGKGWGHFIFGSMNLCLMLWSATLELVLLCCSWGTEMCRYQSGERASGASGLCCSMW